MTILFIADVFGEPGMRVLETFLPALREKYKPDFVIANAENSHEGRGLNDTLVKRYFRLDIDVLTGGNHSFDKHLVFPLMRKEPRILRPFNYPPGNPGFGLGVFPLQSGAKNASGEPLQIGVLNLMGRTFMTPVDDPFAAAREAIDTLRAQTPIIFVDMHAEATAEKMALGWFLDGRVSVIAGTHTHIPTGDARILPGGTGYMTDVGMTGSFNSVIGLDVDTGIRRFTLASPQRFTVADGDARICALLTRLDPVSGRCLHIEPIQTPSFITQSAAMGSEHEGSRPAAGISQADEVSPSGSSDEATPLQDESNGRQEASNR